MSVRLISVSNPKIDGISTAEQLVVWCARVSNPENQNNLEDASRLLKYLIKHEHWSPFEMVSVSMEIKTTRDISRQIIRHRSFSFSEWSQRYSALNKVNFSMREARLQDPKNRQNSIEVDEDSNEQYDFEGLQDEVLDVAYRAYRAALDMGIAKEQARSLLPEGLTNTTLIVSGNLRSWLHYLRLRMANGTQKEHQLIALECLEVLKVEFPTICEAFFAHP
jgi:thymidylate synthase (FAD)